MKTKKADRQQSYEERAKKLEEDQEYIKKMREEGVWDGLGHS